jgi:hypothetical protein
MPRPDAPDDRGPAYTREELLLVGTGFPDRGLRCHKCRTYIPVFADLSVAGETRVREPIRQGRQILAIAELRAETGCSLRWAKIWVVHAGRPNPMTLPETPCPFCGKPLRTSRARQCPHCGADWHGVQSDS